MKKHQNPKRIKADDKISDAADFQNIKQKNIETIKPTGDTTTVSIYKSWKLAANIGKDGIPKNINFTSIFQLLNDGTYKNYLTLENGELIEVKGKFQLFSDNKVIVFTMENANGISTSAAITKLTNKELELKTEEFTSIYSVY